MTSKLHRFLPVLLLVAGLPATPLNAQDPDSVVVADSTAVPVVGDSAVAPSPDSILPEDTVRIYRRLVDMPAEIPSVDRLGPDTWHWSREALLGRPRFTLLELLMEVPGVLPLRWGDYGSPEGVVLDGMTGGRVRVFFDGVEEVELLGSEPDLSRIPLTGLESVTARRVGGELRIDLHALQADEARPLSMIEAGTGDLDTNIFRGTFIQGDAFGGAIGVGIERIDTQGRGANEPGARQGVWLRYMRPVGEKLQIAAEFRRGLSEQTVGRGPDRMQRHASILRGRWAFSEDIVAEGYLARNSLRETEDTVAPISLRGLQYGARVGVEKERWWGRGAIRAFEGDLPSLRLDADVGGHFPEVGFASAHLSRETFDGRTASLWGVSAETRPLLGFSVFASHESGDRGWRGLADTVGIVVDTTVTMEGDTVVTTDEPYPVPTSIGTREASRYGIRFRGFGADVSAARLRTKVDSIRPIATFLDGDGSVFAGDEVEGWEARLLWDLPWIPRGFYLDGSYTRWETPGIYRPEETYRAGLAFHRTYYDTGNFELWFGLFAQGRSGMEIPIRDTEAEVGEDDLFPPQSVPFHQTWNAYLQIRVVTVRIFLRFENLTIRPLNQDYPGRLQLQTRALYGVRWTLFN